MRHDDIRTMDELFAALSGDERFAGYEVAARGEGMVEVRLGETGLALLDAGRFTDRQSIEPHLIRSRAGTTRVVLLGDEDQLYAVAGQADANVASLVPLPMSRARLAVLLPSEMDLIALRSRARERGRVADRYRYELSELLAISRALSSERNVVTLLGLILEKSRYVTGADAGSIYIVEGQGLEVTRRTLRFMVSQNDSMAVDFREFTLPVDDRSIVGKTVLQRALINIPDLYDLDAPGKNPWGVQHNRVLDERSGYRTQSMLTVPLINQSDDVIGVVQLINRKRDPKARLASPEDFAAQVIPFDQRSKELCETLAAQAGVSLDNALLTDEIQKLFEGFVNASVTAIEQRDPTTSGHSERVARLTCGLAQVVDRIEVGPLAVLRFGPDDLKQIEYAGLLHDFGKVGVREKVLVKARKLYEHDREQLLLRFDYVRKSIESDSWRRRLDEALRRGSEAALDAESALGLLALDEKARAELARLDQMMEFILASNEPTVMAAGSAEWTARIEEIAGLRYADARGVERALLLPEEAECLRIARGSLTLGERKEIESHVSHTFNFLATIPWGRKLNRIPHIAGSHHEKLDGTGYPWGLKAPDIPVEAKMMAISDIFDALTASDRPYKKAVPVDRALGILEDEVQRGKCDADLFRAFVEAKVWEPVMRR